MNPLKYFLNGDTAMADDAKGTARLEGLNRKPVAVTKDTPSPASDGLIGKLRGTLAKLQQARDTVQTLRGCIGLDPVPENPTDKLPAVKTLLGLQEQVDQMAHALACDVNDLAAAIGQ